MKRVILICFVLFATLLFVEKASAATATLLVGQSYQTEISTLGYHYLSIESITSNNPSVSATKMGMVVKATVNSYFSGIATITIRLRYQLYAGQNYQYRNQEFTLSCNETQINVSPTSTTLCTGNTIQLATGFNTTTYITPSIQWTSSDENVATVSSDGLVTGISEGNATIYVRSNLGSNTAHCSIKVIKNGSDTGGNQNSSSADVTWYNADNTEFELSTLAQILGFRNLVNQGEHFINKTIRLVNDIDLSSYNWTTPISIYPNVFEGTFDGCGHSLTIYANKVETGTQNEFYFGFFGNSWGKIKNLTIKGNVTVEVANMTTYAYVGTLCGTASFLESCVNEASLTYIRSYVKSAGNADRIGGLTGNCGKPVTNCINRGAVLTKTKYSSSNTNNYYIGGISGYGNDMTGCANYGTIKNEVSGNSDYGMLREYIGGISGWIVNSDLKRCSNFGNIIGNSQYSGVGGLIGGSGGSNKVLDSYVGKCTIANNKGGSASYVNSICGYLNKDTFTHNFSASDISYVNKRNGEGGNAMYTSTQMRTTEFAEVLGQTFWIGADELYPVVKKSPDEYKYYISTISNVTCTGATLSSNVGDILSDEIKSWGFLLTLDDGKETYIPGERDNYSIIITDLIPDRNYKVRWYAQDKQGVEYYGVYNTFKTKGINPTTLPCSQFGVFDAVLKGETFYVGADRLGFFIQKVGQDDNGLYLWSDITTENTYSITVNGLEGNTAYNFCTVIDVNGIIYNGDMHNFTTKSIATSYPTDFTNNNTTLNGQIGIAASSAWFEIRALSWPSVIESEMVLIDNVNTGTVSMPSPNLLMNETYAYRLVIKHNAEILYGEWIEFLFEGEAGLNTINADSIDLTKPIEIYNLQGHIIYSGLDAYNNLEKGIYIIRQGEKVLKIRI